MLTTLWINKYRLLSDSWIITAWYNRGKNDGGGYTKWEKNARAESPEERKLCGTQKSGWRLERVAEIVKN